MKALATASAPWHAHMIGSLLIYNLVVFLIFAPIYIFLPNFKKHFETDIERPTLGDKLYLALMHHSNAMAGDITPKTETARRIVSIHILLTWLQLLFVFYTAAPAAATGGRVNGLVSAAATKANVIVVSASKLAKAVKNAA